MTALTEIDSDTIREVLMEVVEDILGTSNFHVSLEPGSKKGDNFVGIVYRIAFSRTDGFNTQNGVAKKKSGQLFLKVAPTNLLRREHFSARICFLREMYVYNEV